MLFSQQEKMDWIEQVLSTIAFQINQEYKTQAQDLPKKSDQELPLLADELTQGFLWIMEALETLYPPAATEIFNWAIQKRGSFDTFFQFDPKSYEQVPLDLIVKMQQLIPGKFILYFFYAAQHIFHKQEKLKADRAFRLLTILYPHVADFWVWLGSCQQERLLPQFALISYSIAKTLASRDPSLDVSSLEPESLKKPENLSHKIDTLYYSNGSEKELFPLLVPDEWKAFLSELEEEIADITQLLMAVKERITDKICTLGFFEEHTIILSQNELKAPIASFFNLDAWVLCYFFGALVTGMSFSAENRQIKREIASNHPSKIAYVSSLILDLYQPLDKCGIGKNTYLYNPCSDRVQNQLAFNVEYGTVLHSYQECNREDNRIRASRFYPQDIVGKSILDFGCNEGGILFACRNLGATSITGVDINTFVISKAKERVETQKIPDAHFFLGDVENRALFSRLPKSDTVLLLAVLDTSQFVNTTAVISNISRLAKETLYYEGHVNPESHVQRLYELLIATDFTRFEYLGRFDSRILIRCSRELMKKEQLRPGVITSDDDDFMLMEASEIYLFTDSPRNPPFSSKCRLIQFVERS